MSQQTAPPVGPQQMMYQQPYPEHKAPVEYLRPLASDFLLAIGIVLGLFLLMLGSIISGVGDSAAANDAGRVVASLGNFIAAAVLFMGAIVRVDIDKLVRFGFILAATLMSALIGFW